MPLINNNVVFLQIMMMMMMMMTIMFTATIVRITAFSSSSSSTINTINAINTDLGDRNRPILGAVASAAAAAATIITPKSTITESTDTSTVTVITIEERVDKILEYIDNNILLLNNKPSSSSSSLSTKTNSILERIQNQHLDDYNTAKLSCLEIESNEEQEQEGRRRQSVLCSYESIPHPIEQQQQQHPSILAIKSTEPILDIDSVQAIRKAAEDIWNKEEQESNNNNKNNNEDSSSSTSSSSKFTYQYKGNSEAHVFDFDSTTDTGKKALSALNIALQTKIYPMIRDAFLIKKNNNDKNTDSKSKLFVYDALVIRYNATAAAQADASSGGALLSIGGAGQPFHRDLGLVSINIMLNSNNEFNGGGTFFENQLLSRTTASSSTSLSTSAIQSIEPIEPIKPNDTGYCIAHSASERHAGAGTIHGVRDILVLFISAATIETASSKSKYKSNTMIDELYTSPLVHSTPNIDIDTDTDTDTDTDADADTDSVIHITPPSEILSARLKTCRSFCEQQEKNSPYDDVLLCRILHLKLAVEYSSLIQSTTHQSSYDGEAIQYLGTVLMEYADYHDRHDSNDDNSKDDSVQQVDEIYEVALNCYQISKLLTPCDSRIYNNIGILLGKKNDIDKNNDTTCITTHNKQREIAYKHGINILKLSKDSGVKTNNDLYSLSLNYGLFLANEDRYNEATIILRSILIPNDNDNDAYRLWKFCKSRIE